MSRNLTAKKLLLQPNETTEAYEINPHFWEPPFQINAEKATPILSYIVCIYLSTIFLFAVVKCTYAHGIKLWMLHRLQSTSFPRRPEIILFCCSTIPTMTTILFHSAAREYHNVTLTIGLEWGSCQSVLFLDLFTRTAGIYHMLYWTYSAIFNCAFFKLHLMRLGFQHNYDYSNHNRKELKKIKSQFKTDCKRRIPFLIYFFSFIITMPILIMAEKVLEPTTKLPVCKRIFAFEFYHYYDLVMLIIFPLLAVTVRFYSSALHPNKRHKMNYKLRCYHVIFILLNIPIFVLNVVFEAFKATQSPEIAKSRFANGILISLTAYHTAFAIKPLVYTTGCNCICCGDHCLAVYPRVNRWVLYWSNPQLKNKNAYSEPIQVTID